MSAVAMKKRGDAQFATAYSAWSRLMRMYPVSERVQHQVISYVIDGTAKTSFLKIFSEPKHVLCVAKDDNAVDIIRRRISCNFLRESRI
jgi:hypothetical protein